MAFIMLALVLLLISVAVQSATTFQTVTTPYEAPRPSGVPGGGGSGTFGYPGKPDGNSAYFGGGGVWATGGAAGGQLAGTAAGGPNGPNQAGGHATGQYAGFGGGEAAGTAAPTGAAGHLSGALGPGSAFVAATGAPFPPSDAGCGGGAVAGAGYTQCVTL